MQKIIYPCLVHLERVISQLSTGDRYCSLQLKLIVQRQWSKSKIKQKIGKKHNFERLDWENRGY